MRRTAAIVTVGSELTDGLRVDTNTAEVARALGPFGFHVTEAISVGDHADVLATELARLCGTRDLVITTGGLGPTHDDITRDAAAAALGVDLVVDDRLAVMLRPIQDRHADPGAIANILKQACVIPGAQVIDFVTGTAPGLVVETDAGLLCLLPGPPSEMRPMLREFLCRFDQIAAAPRELGVVGLSESDAQVLVERAIDGIDGIGFTILAKPGDVRVILTDAGGGAFALAQAATAAERALGDRCHSADGSTLAGTVIALGKEHRVSIALAESCTGGMVASALTDVAGSSEVFVGGIVAYSNDAKSDLLNVPAQLLAKHGAVSGETVDAMSIGALAAFAAADVSVAISGIAGPGGGSDDKPVGTVWFSVASRSQTGISFPRFFAGASRDAVRQRATAVALDCLRRHILGLPLPT